MTVVGNYRPLPGETHVLVDPVFEMRVYDSLPAPLRAVVANAESKIRPSIVAAALVKMSPDVILSVIQDTDAGAQARYEAACFA